MLFYTYKIGIAPVLFSIVASVVGSHHGRVAREEERMEGLEKVINYKAQRGEYVGQIWKDK